MMDLMLVVLWVDKMVQKLVDSMETLSVDSRVDSRVAMMVD